MTRTPVTIVTYDWLPEFPRGYVRDIRARWAAEETGTPYSVETVPSHPRSDAHRAMQPFAQVPVLKDGDLTLFESGAILLHLAQGTDLLPEARRSEITQWLIAALNSVEPVSGRWNIMLMSERLPQIFGPASPPEVKEHTRKLMLSRFDALEKLLATRDWIAGDFSVADIMLVDVLRPVAAEGGLEGYPLLTAYVDRATARPAFKKAMADHMAHWTDADRAKAEKQGAPA
jgi:glutathione S-transferase